MGHTWKKKIQKGKRGKPHNPRLRLDPEIPRAKQQRALRSELEIVKERTNQPPREA